jgi:catechol 2,3-dioxygenase-like lactoylglutathione lyase family enzyme
VTFFGPADSNDPKRGQPMAITGMVHFNVNCSDYERSRVLPPARLRGGVARAETNTPEVAAAVGMPPYRVTGGLLALRGAAQPVVIDLLQWLEPHDASPPYPHLYHYGIARVALATSDLDGDMAKLQAAGAEFLSKPAQMPPESGSRARFVCFKDPDGTVLELVEP